MRRALLVQQRRLAFSHGISETLWTQYPHANAPIAPIATQIVAGSLRILVLSMPPSAATGNRIVRAMLAQRSGPRAAAPGWLAVTKTGERKTRTDPAWAARRMSAGPWAELVIRRCLLRTCVGRTRQGQRPERR